jgi:hypothetical protein
VAAKRMVRLPSGKEGLELLPDRLNEVGLERGYGARSFRSGSVENCPDDGVYGPALLVDAFPIDASS